MRGTRSLSLSLVGMLILAGCGAVLAPYRERQCREDGGVPYSEYRMFGQYEGTRCWASDPLAPGGSKVLWYR